jgi:hypothetical protein
MLDGSRDELRRNSDKAGLSLCNRKEAAMPELIGSRDNLWVYFRRDMAGRDHASDCGTAGPRAVSGAHRDLTLKPAVGAGQWANHRLSPKRCSTCEHLRRLCARNQVAFRSARNLYRTAVEAPDSAALPKLEEELKQISAARNLIYYAIHEHLSGVESQDARSPWAA